MLDAETQPDLLWREVWRVWSVQSMPLPAALVWLPTSPSPTCAREETTSFVSMMSMVELSDT